MKHKRARVYTWLCVYVCVWCLCAYACMYVCMYVCVCACVSWSPFQPLDKTNYFVSELSVGLEHGHQLQQWIGFVAGCPFFNDNRKSRIPILDTSCARVCVCVFIYVCMCVCTFVRLRMCACARARVITNEWQTIVRSCEKVLRKQHHLCLLRVNVSAIWK